MQECRWDLRFSGCSLLIFCGVLFSIHPLIFLTVLWHLLFSADPDDRAQLSTFRNIGATLASLVIGTGTPLIAYETVNGATVLSGSKMTIIAGVFAACGIICHLLCFNLVTERIEVPQNTTN